MRNRSAQIQLLTRLNRGKHARPSFLSELSKAIGEHITADALIPLPETDLLIELMRSAYQGSKSPEGPNYQRFFRSNERAKFFDLGDCIAKRLFDEPVYLITKASDICGAVKTNIRAVLSHAASLTTLDGDSVCVVSEDREQGLLMDTNTDDALQSYELVVWGRRWREAASICDAGG